jgi:hypothetical protein
MTPTDEGRSVHGPNPPERRDRLVKSMEHLAEILTSRADVRRRREALTDVRARLLTEREDIRCSATYEVAS